MLKLLVAYFIIVLAIGSFLDRKLSKQLGYNAVLIDETNNNTVALVHRCMLLMYLAMVVLTLVKIFWPYLMNLPEIYEPNQLFLPPMIGGLLIVSLGVYILGRFTLGKSWRVGFNPEKAGNIVNNGIYRFIRHPIYLAHILAFIAAFLLINHSFMLVVAVLGIYSCILMARLEEDFLQQEMLDYKEYMKNGKRFIPFLY